MLKKEVTTQAVYDKFVPVMVADGFSEKAAKAIIEELLYTQPLQWFFCDNIVYLSKKDDEEIADEDELEQNYKSCLDSINDVFTEFTSEELADSFLKEFGDDEKAEKLISCPNVVKAIIE
ncbi:MAG: hypothetical protein MJZ26_11425 [Fibrobacter sp.]|nr:hypothetical protein [Fibrobacter sp.]